MNKFILGVLVPGLVIAVSSCSSSENVEAPETVEQTEAAEDSNTAEDSGGLESSDVEPDSEAGDEKDSADSPSESFEEAEAPDDENVDSDISESDSDIGEESDISEETESADDVAVCSFNEVAAVDLSTPEAREAAVELVDISDSEALLEAARKSIDAAFSNGYKETVTFEQGEEQSTLFDPAQPIQSSTVLYSDDLPEELGAIPLFLNSLSELSPGMKVIEGQAESFVNLIENNIGTEEDSEQLGRVPNEMLLREALKLNDLRIADGFSWLDESVTPNSCVQVSLNSEGLIAEYVSTSDGTKDSGSFSIRYGITAEERNLIDSTYSSFE